MRLNELEQCVEQAECVYSAADISAALAEQASKINSRLDSLSDLSEPAVFLPVMNGGLIYAGQLLPLISKPVVVDYIHATRYRNTTRGFELEWKVYPQTDLSGRLVVVLDDILDEGHTLDAIVKYCQQQGAASVLSAVLVTKQHDRRDNDITADFSALDVPDRYVFGYGMDYKGQLRNLNGIYSI